MLSVLGDQCALNRFCARITFACFSGFDPSLMAQGSQAIRESSSVLGEGNSLGR
jgi:hypothetical protein